MPAHRDAYAQLPIPAVDACVQAATVRVEIPSTCWSDVFLPWTRGPGGTSTVPVPKPAFPFVLPEMEVTVEMEAAGVERLWSQTAEG
eukprot:3939520-Rhodomonas_salina.2